MLSIKLETPYMNIEANKREFNNTYYLCITDKTRSSFPVFYIQEHELNIINNVLKNLKELN